MLNQQGLFEDHDQELCGTGLFSCLPQSISTATCIPQPIFHFNSLKTLTTSINSPINNPLTLLPQQNPQGIFLSFAANPKHTDDMPSHFHRSNTTNPWGWGELNDCTSSKQRSDSAGEDLEDCGGGGHHHNHHHRIGISAVKMKKIKSMTSCGRRKVREPRFCFKTMSDVDVLDDGYKWRKYGQKVVKNTHHPRSYYRCTQDNCRVKKRVERLAEDPRMVITTYEGRHVHSPSHDEDDSQSPSRLNNFFW